ncbi:hypothetical protein HBF19_16360 [Agrobacterium tumefaciens]|jgi:hypothetical protein|nr:MULTISPECIES: hypothetical protein [Agrobacterium tumefaciens complex]NIB11625.1 hypothetical protein [Agrobacterium radiobacter]
MWEAVLGNRFDYLDSLSNNLTLQYPETQCNRAESHQYTPHALTPPARYLAQIKLQNDPPRIVRRNVERAYLPPSPATPEAVAKTSCTSSGNFEEARHLFSFRSNKVRADGVARFTQD